MLEWPNSTVFEALSSVADSDPDATALVFNGEKITYSELRDRSLAFADALAEREIDRGDRIAVWLANRPEWLYAQFGAAALGVAVVAVNTRYRKHELKYMLEDSNAKALVMEQSFLGRDYLDMLSDLAPAVHDGDPTDLDIDAFPDLSSVISIEPTETYDGVTSFDSFTGEPGADVETVGDAELPVALFYTSGTTGDPKGCVHDSRSVLNHSYNVGTYLDITDDDVGLGAVPFCGGFGYNVWLSCISHGISLVVQTHFDPERTVDLVDRHDVTYFSATAQMYLRTIDADNFSPERVETLRRGTMFFANGYNEPDFERIEAAAGFPVCQPYGLSEANTQIFVGDPEAPTEQRKKVGGPLIHEELSAKIVDPETREPLPDGERGELALAGYNVMQGYLGKPEETAEVIDDEGWFYTGDLCERDEVGNIYYHSRIGDALRVRGFLVSPQEIEAVIDEHPDIIESQVVGAPHPRHGQVPIAFVRAAESVDEDDVIAYIEEQVADYKIPEEALVVEEFPQTEGPHGKKIQKNVLRERVQDRY